MMQKDNIIIRKFQEEYVFSIAEIEKECFSEPWSVNTIKAQLENPNALILVALCDNKVVGYVNTYVILDEADINNIAVTKDFRKLGIAKMLMTALLDEIKVVAIHLEVRESNFAAINLYDKFGFQKVGLRKNFYNKPTENAILMTKKVNQ